MASSGQSVIQLTPASASFVARRVDTLGPWVLGAFTDCILMGVVFCQVHVFLMTRTPAKTGFQRYCFWLVFVVLFMSILKTIQEISVVWVQNVNDFANPDVARLRVSRSWWQVSTPFTTGVIGCVVQTFFCIRYYLLSHNLYLVVPIVCFMILGISGISLTVYHILAEHDKAKVMWLLIHLIGVFIADFLITTGTFVELRRRSSGLERTTLLVNRLMRLVFESAIPPTLIASIDLIMTQTLGKKLLWHLLLNFSLGKIYVISLLYTLNSINEYRRENASDNHDIYTSDGHSGGISRRNNVELGNLSTKPDQILIQTEVSVSTHVSPIPGKSRAIELKHHSSAIRDDFKAYSTD